MSYDEVARLACVLQYKIVLLSPAWHPWSQSGYSVASLVSVSKWIHVQMYQCNIISFQRRWSDDGEADWSSTKTFECDNLWTARSPHKRARLRESRVEFESDAKVKSLQAGKSSPILLKDTHYNRANVGVYFASHKTSMLKCGTFLV